MMNNINIITTKSIDDDLGEVCDDMNTQNSHYFLSNKKNSEILNDFLNSQPEIVTTKKYSFLLDSTISFTKEMLHIFIKNEIMLCINYQNIYVDKNCEITFLISQYIRKNYDLTISELETNLKELLLINKDLIYDIFDALTTINMCLSFSNEFYTWLFENIKEGSYYSSNIFRNMEINFKKVKNFVNKILNNSTFIIFNWSMLPEEILISYVNSLNYFDQAKFLYFIFSTSNIDFYRKILYLIDNNKIHIYSEEEAETSKFFLDLANPEEEKVRASNLNIYSLNEHNDILLNTYNIFFKCLFAYSAHSKFNLMMYNYDSSEENNVKGNIYFSEKDIDIIIKLTDIQENFRNDYCIRFSNFFIVSIRDLFKYKPLSEEFIKKYLSYIPSDIIGNKTNISDYTILLYKEVDK